MKAYFYENYLERLENLQHELQQEVQNLPPQGLDWVPGPEMNSIAVLLAHISGSLRYWIGDIAMEEPSGRVRDSEFRTQGLSAGELLNRLEGVVAYARDTLPRLKLEDLEQERHARDEQVTVAWALLHALEHAYLHLGQIQLTRQLWEEQPINS